METSDTQLHRTRIKQSSLITQNCSVLRNPYKRPRKSFSQNTLLQDAHDVHTFHSLCNISLQAYHREWKKAKAMIDDVVSSIHKKALQQTFTKLARFHDNRRADSQNTIQADTFSRIPTIILEMGPEAEGGDRVTAFDHAINLIANQGPLLHHPSQRNLITNQNETHRIVRLSGSTHHNIAQAFHSVFGAFSHSQHKQDTLTGENQEFDIDELTEIEKARTHRNAQNRRSFKIDQNSSSIGLIDSDGYTSSIQTADSTIPVQGQHPSTDSCHLVICVEDVQSFSKDCIGDLIYLCGKYYNASKDQVNEFYQNIKMKSTDGCFRFPSSHVVQDSLVFIFVLNTQTSVNTNEQSVSSLLSMLTLRELDLIEPFTTRIPAASVYFDQIMDNLFLQSALPLNISSHLYKDIKTSFQSKDKTIAAVEKIFRHIYFRHFSVTSVHSGSNQCTSDYVQNLIKLRSLPLFYDLQVVGTITKVATNEMSPLEYARLFSHWKSHFSEELKKCDFDWKSLIHIPSYSMSGIINVPTIQWVENAWLDIISALTINAWLQHLLLSLLQVFPLNLSGSPSALRIFEDFMFSSTNVNDCQSLRMLVDFLNSPSCGKSDLQKFCDLMRDKIEPIVLISKELGNMGDKSQLHFAKFESFRNDVQDIDNDVKAFEVDNDITNEFPKDSEIRPKKQGGVRGAVAAQLKRKQQYQMFHENAARRRIMSPLIKLKSRASFLIRSIFSLYAHMNIKDLPLYEIIYSDCSVDSVDSIFSSGKPRQSLIDTLAGKKGSNYEGGTDASFDARIAFRYLWEGDRALNTYDWYENFSIFKSESLKITYLSTDEMKARFAVAMSDLEHIGLFKVSKSKASQVSRILF